MANVARVRATWAGAAVTGPGVSTFYFNEIHSGFVSALGAYFTAWASWIPTGTTVTIQNTGDLLDIPTGQISGTWTDGTTQVVAMTGAGVYNQGVGVRVKWNTAGIRNGRRVRGSTFMVPTIGAAQATDGTPAAAALTAWNTAVSTLVTTSVSEMVTYSRPAPALAGQASEIISGSVADAVSWLRTRRT
jgi:hypothetical protein